MDKAEIMTATDGVVFTFDRGSEAELEKARSFVRSLKITPCAILASTGETFQRVSDIHSDAKRFFLIPQAAGG